MPGQLIKFTCIILDTKWDAWKGAARISLREYISSSVSGCLIGDPGMRAARISKPAIRFLREGWKGIGRNFIYSGGGGGSKNSNRSVDSVIHRDRGGGGGRWASE